MENKVLIRLNVLELDTKFDVFIPVNEIVWKIKKLLVKVVSNMFDISLDSSMHFLLMNQENCRIYEENEIVIDTDIRNGTELLLVSVK